MTGQMSFFKKQRQPDFSFEEKYDGPVAGLDEVGRGPLAGPVVAAAVILDAGNIPKGLNDSKKLTSKKREALVLEIEATALIGIGQASVEEIDDINILEASMLAMRRALQNLPKDPVACLVDGNRDPGLSFPTRCLIKGDSLSLSIAAASIIAKVFRDKLMTELAKKHPEYGWEQNAGYGVPHHLKALDAVGPCPHHRKSFQPVRAKLLKESLITH
jgi:ribonuclease HII